MILLVIAVAVLPILASALVTIVIAVAAVVSHHLWSIFN